MIKIKPLKKGDTIGIISPAFCSSKKPEEYQYMIDNINNTIKNKIILYFFI